jgi:coiled-coil-helix-coiled-coil-helix domain-containing protein 3
VFGSDSLSLKQKHEQEIRVLEKSWRQQMNELERQNRELWKSANHKLSNNLNEIEKKYVKTKCEPICGENEKKVIECYQTNKSQPLKCSKEVKGFVNCVHEIRRNVLNRNG